MKNKELIVKHIERHYNPRDIGYKDIILLSKLFNIDEYSIAKLIDYKFKLGFKCCDILDVERNRCSLHNVKSIYYHTLYGYQPYGNSKRDNNDITFKIYV